MEENNTTITVESIDNKNDVEKLAKETASLHKWQKNLLPFLIGVPTILIIVFIFFTTRQINDFNSKLNQDKDSEFLGSIIPSPLNAYNSNIQYIKWVTLFHMEQESINKRYKQAGFLLMSRVLTKYLGFLTGMILAIVGAAFIIGKLSENTTTIEGSFSEKAKLNIASSSPGILFGLLGTILMLATILTHSEISVQDRPLYLNPNTIQFIGDGKTDSSGIQKIKDLVDSDKLDSLDKVKNKKQ